MWPTADLARIVAEFSQLNNVVGHIASINKTNYLPEPQCFPSSLNLTKKLSCEIPTKMFSCETCPSSFRTSTLTKLRVYKGPLLFLVHCNSDGVFGNGDILYIVLGISCNQSIQSFRYSVGMCWLITCGCYQPLKRSEDSAGNVGIKQSSQ